MSKKGLKKPAVFLDRDGVINRHLPGDYVKNWSEFEFLPGAAQAIRNLKGMGYLVVVITNQQGVGRGLMTQEDLDEIHGRMMAELESRGAQIDAVYSCSHRADYGCACRKPEPGLIVRAAQDFVIEMNSSYLVGDSESDMEAARRAGCRPVYLGDARQVPEGDCLIYSDLLSFASDLSKGEL